MLKAADMTGPNYYSINDIESMGNGEQPSSSSQNEHPKKEPRIVAFTGKSYSLKPDNAVENTMFDDEEDPELRAALRASMSDFTAKAKANSSAPIMVSSHDETTLRTEPTAEVMDTVTVQFIIPPSGKKIRRKFDANWSLGQLFLFAESLSEIKAAAPRGFSLNQTESNKLVVRDDDEKMSSLGKSCALRVVPF